MASATFIHTVLRISASRVSVYCCDHQVPGTVLCSTCVLYKV